MSDDIFWTGKSLFSQLLKEKLKSKSKSKKTTKKSAMVKKKKKTQSSITPASGPAGSTTTRIWFENGRGRNVWFEEPEKYASLKAAKQAVDQDQLPKDSYSSEDLRTRVAFVVGPKSTVHSIHIYEYNEQNRKRGQMVAQEIYGKPKRIQFIENKLSSLV